MVVHRLVPEVYLEGDFVLRAGDPGHALYFIARGECGVLGALEQILHRVNEMERKMPRGRAGM